MAFEYLTSFGTYGNLPLWLMYLVIVWTAIWKLVGLWKSARNKHIVWFIIMGVFNTVGILPILYIFIFSKFKKKRRIEKSAKAISRNSRKKSSKKK
jgi:hypothetical protein